MAPMVSWRLASSVLLLAALGAQEPVAEPPRRQARVGRVAEAEAPSIDGRLEDPCWAAAPAIGDLVMVEPWEGRAPTQRTVVKLLHDRHNLYIALWCFDDAPQEIRASMRARDARLDPDDRVEILLDPFENRRTAYFFQIGAGGSIGDILISNDGGKFDKPWDAIWSGAAKVTEAGWMAEIAIPFRSIPRLDGARSWGFNLKRYVRTRNEEYQWANATQSVTFYRASQCGTIEGFGPIDGGIGLEAVPYVSLTAGRDRAAADPDWDVDPDAGGELYYRLSPSMTAALTLFTDFAETEDDGRQINLNRFPLFFPEKRDFFLDGIGYFGFGASSAGGTTYLPFFTRRIGLASDGSEVPLLGGVKLTGQSGPFEVGLLDVQTDATATLDSENLAAARIKYALGDQTTVGVLGTHGDPQSEGENGVFGADFYHRLPRFVGDLDLRATVDIAASAGSGESGESLGAQLDSRGREWTFETGLRWISDDFDPALGFVRRRGSRATNAKAQYSPRFGEGGLVRNGNIRLAVARQEEGDGTTQDKGFSLEKLGVDFHSGDSAFFYAQRAFERVDDDFLLFRDSTVVYAGDYWQTRCGVQVLTTEGRAWNASLRAETGDFFDGHSDDLQGEVEWRQSALLHFGGSYATSIVDLGPGRAFTTHIASGRLDLHFTPALSLRNLVQFDNESNGLGWQSRLRWIYSPGCDFYAVLGASWLREDDGTIAPTEQQLELKVSHSMRF
jgi:hypothetical protein